MSAARLQRTFLAVRLSSMTLQSYFLASDHCVCASILLTGLSQKTTVLHELTESSGNRIWFVYFLLTTNDDINISKARPVKHLFHRCSIALWRGNASLWLSPPPNPPPFSCCVGFSFLCVLFALLCPFSVFNSYHG